MEIIAEIVLQVLGWILEVFGELLLQVIFEFIAEFLGHSVKSPFRKLPPIPPWLAAIGYVVLGALAGLLSLWLMPEVFIKAPWLRAVNLLLTPVGAGLIMAWSGSRRSRKDKDVIRIESFSYGFCFAFSLALVRFVWGH